MFLRVGKEGRAKYGRKAIVYSFTFMFLFYCMKGLEGIDEGNSSWRGKFFFGMRFGYIGMYGLVINNVISVLLMFYFLVILGFKSFFNRNKFYNIKVLND